MTQSPNKQNQNTNSHPQSQTELGQKDQYSNQSARNDNNGERGQPLSKEEPASGGRESGVESVTRNAPEDRAIYSDL